MHVESTIAGLFLIWFAILATLLFVLRPRGQGGALIISYFLILSLLHIPGALAFLDPLSDMPGRDETVLGFQVTLVGMGAFVAGVALCLGIGGRPGVSSFKPSFELVRLYKFLSNRMLMIGFGCYFLLLPVANRVPSLAAVVSPLGSLIVLGYWLKLYYGYLSGDRRVIQFALMSLPLLPVTTLMFGGFLGFGIVWMINVAAFFYAISKRRIWFLVGLPIAVYVGLSFFTTYMALRSDIRSTVWNQQSGSLDRIESLSGLFTGFQPFSLESPLVLYALNLRLNQNFLVGAGVERYLDGRVNLTYGSTVQLWALIPRAIWPNKPEIGGSGHVVSDFTGIEFAPGTSVGAGQVLEFYMNFAIYGEVIGFFLLGFIMMRLDTGIMRALERGDVQRLLLLSMIGLVFMSGGSLLEIFVAIVAAGIDAKLLLASGFFGRLDSKNGA